MGKGVFRSFGAGKFVKKVFVGRDEMARDGKLSENEPNVKRYEITIFTNDWSFQLCQRNNAIVIEGKLWTSTIWWRIGSGPQITVIIYTYDKYPNSNDQGFQDRYKMVAHAELVYDLHLASIPPEVKSQLSIYLSISCHFGSFNLFEGNAFNREIFRKDAYSQIGDVVGKRCLQIRNFVKPRNVTKYNISNCAH